jgi:hypothetical protein
MHCFKTLSTTLENTLNSLQELQQSHQSSIEHTEDNEIQLQNVIHMVNSIDPHLSTIEKGIKEFKKHFSIIFRIIQDWHMKTPQPNVPDLIDMQDELQTLADKVQAIDQNDQLLWVGLLNHPWKMTSLRSSINSRHSRCR